MNKEEIKKILPHREPMLLVDEVELIDGVAHGKCHIRGDEYFLQGHFPGNPVVPGVIQCEMMAQSACVLLASGAAEGCTPMFTSLDKVKFRGQVKPGDTLETECAASARSSPSPWSNPNKGAPGPFAERMKACVHKNFNRQPGGNRHPDYPGL